MNKPIIPLFFAVDDNFAKYTVVTLHSLIKNASRDYDYKVRILSTVISDDMKEKVAKMQDESFSIEFVDVTSYVESISSKLPLRHYYSKTTYFRFFIAEMFPEYDKAVYLDSDLIIQGDISKLYETDIGDYYLAGCHEQAMEQMDVYGTYVEEVMGISRHNFFNAGMMLINCKQFREKKILERFVTLLGEYNFIVTQDEDYLNVICKDHVYWLDQRWNTELFATFVYPYNEAEAYILHYMMVNKPWHYADCRCADVFWSYAKETSVYDALMDELNNYTEADRKHDADSGEALKQMALNEIAREDNFLKLQKKNLKSPYRVALVDKIRQYELEGRFDEDVEDDPPSRTIMPDEVDYLRKKLSSKIKTKIAHKKAKIFLKTILKHKIMMIKDIKGIENWQNLDTGAIITCNHFNAFDSFAIQEAYHASNKWPKSKFYRVIKEGNYTSFPGFFGELMRHFYTLPLSSNVKTMVKFTDATNTLLKEGNFVLFYPEQAMWWNYRKPRPLKPGAYKFAVKNKVPVLPCFITMRDSDILGQDLRSQIKGFEVSENFIPDGYYVQEYTIHIGKPIYPRDDLDNKANMQYMADKNFEIWKEIYEKEYDMPLDYSKPNN